MMKVVAGRLEFARGIELRGKRVLALIVPRGTSLQDYDSYFDVREAKPLPGSDNTVFALPINVAK